MEANNNSDNAVTDGEQWSDDTERSNESGMTSPQHAGYVPLGQFYEDDEDGDVQGEAVAERQGEGLDEQQQRRRQRQGAPETAGGIAEAWRESVSHESSSESEGESPRADVRVASALLLAMEADYRACLQSEERLSSNGPVNQIAQSETNNIDATGSRGADATESSNPDRSSISELQRVTGEPGTLDGEETRMATDGIVDAEVQEGAQERPISPLGRDQAGRVMRAMQGFALSAPTLPRPRFEANWESADAIANLADSR